MNKKVKLSNGYIIPSIGYGTYQSPISEETTQNVLYALKCGYRHIDTATKYGNEKQVGIAIKKSKIKREDIFVTTKLWNTDQGYKNTIIAFNKSLKELNLKYVDLYLIHWPIPLGKEKSYKKLNIET
jgi:diketogulonate reductase-like aldo/keto reductase